MRRLFIIMILPLSLFISNVSGQENNASFLQKLSLEGGAGYHLPFTPNKNIITSNYAGFRSFYLGANYAINDIWGLRMTYANNVFSDKNDRTNKFTIQKVMAEATFNILQSIQTQQNPFEIVAHSGIGVSAGKGPHLSDIDKMANFQFGLMPLYRITRYLSMQLDATYVINIQQNQGYNGQYVYDDVRDVTGSYLLFNMGLGIKFDF